LDEAEGRGVEEKRALLLDHNGLNPGRLPKASVSDTSKHAGA
jgi:hypothetical protein